LYEIEIYNPLAASLTLTRMISDLLLNYLLLGVAPCAIANLQHSSAALSIALHVVQQNERADLAWSKEAVQSTLQ